MPSPHLAQSSAVPLRSWRCGFERTGITRAIVLGNFWEYMRYAVEKRAEQMVEAFKRGLSRPKGVGS
jgi:hypothetical protein